VTMGLSADMGMVCIFELLVVDGVTYNHEMYIYVDEKRADSESVFP